VLRSSIASLLKKSGHPQAAVLNLFNLMLSDIVPGLRLMTTNRLEWPPTLIFLNLNQ
jgi:hypothetical protein